MPRIRKITDCSENIAMKVMKTRLIEISLMVDNYIYKQKPITENQAKAFLDEISSYKFQCKDDIGYLQVIEKLTKYMNIIISNYTNRNTDCTNTLDDTTILNRTNQNPLPPANIVFVQSSKQKQDKTDKPTIDQNNSEWTLSNESTLNIIKVSNDMKYDGVKKCCNQLNDINLRKTTGFQEHNTVNISSKIAENSDVNNLQALLKANLLESDVIHKIENTPASVPKIQEKNNKDFLLFRVNEEGNNVHNLLNATAESKTSEVNIVTKLNPQTKPKEKKINFDKEKKPRKRVNKGHTGNFSLFDKPVGIEVNKKKVKFKEISKALTKTELSKKSKSEDENDKTKLFINRTSKQPNLQKNTFSKNPRTKKVSTKNTQLDTIKDANISNGKKSKRIVDKGKINKLKNDMIGDASPKELKLNSNAFNEEALDNLSWFDSIKYVREIDEQEFFRPIQLLDDKFWCNQTLPLIDAKDFNI